MINVAFTINGIAGAHMQRNVFPGAQENKRPSLATLKIGLSEEDPGKDVDLIVNLRFSEDDSYTLLGVIRYRLRKAAVSITFDGCHVHSIDNAFGKIIDFTVSEIHEIEGQTSRKDLKSREESRTLEFSSESQKLADGKKKKDGKEISLTSRHKINFEYDKPLVSVSGTDEFLRFVFESPQPSIALRGCVQPEQWCSLSFTALHSKISARLTAAPDDVIIGGVGGIWPRDLSEDKSFLIRLYALRILDINQYISLSELHIDEDHGSAEDKEMTIANNSMRAEEGDLL